MRVPMLALCAVSLGGCFSIPQPSMDQWRQAQQRHFDHITTPEFEAALQRVFSASVPGGYSVRPAPGGAIAERNYDDFAMLAVARGLERWQITYAAKGDDIDAHADVVNIPGQSFPADINVQIRPDTPATYELFWQRLGYVLNARKEWPTCRDYAASLRFKSKDPIQSWGLCGTGSSDVPPQKISQPPASAARKAFPTL
ncbi:MAG: hypothetical protein ACREHF_02070 [Rhizomicrobium sp.]